MKNVREKQEQPIANGYHGVLKGGGGSFFCLASCLPLSKWYWSVSAALFRYPKRPNKSILTRPNPLSRSILLFERLISSLIKVCHVCSDKLTIRSTTIVVFFLRLCPIFFVPSTGRWHYIVDVLVVIIVIAILFPQNEHPPWSLWEKEFCHGITTAGSLSSEINL